MYVPSLMDLFHRWIRDWGWSTEVDTSSYYRSSLVGGGFSSVSQDYSRTENLPSSFGQRCLVLCLLCLYVHNVLYVYNCRHEKAIKPSCILFNDTWSCIMCLVPCIWSCMTIVFSSADPKVSSAELMVLLICPSSVVVRPSTFALNRYSSYSSYSIILNFLLEKLGI